MSSFVLDMDPAGPDPEPGREDPQRPAEFLPTRRPVRKVAMITGRPSPRVTSIAAALAEAGFDLVLHTHGAAPWAGEAARAASDHGRQAFLVAGDPGDAGAMHETVEAVRRAYGRLDVVVNCGCRPREEPRASALVVGAAAPLLGACAGAVVHLLEDPVADGDARDALLALTRGMSRLLSPRVRVNAVAPPAGPMEISAPGALQRLDRTPAERDAEVVRAVLFLLGSPHLNGEVLVAERGARR